MGMHTNGPEHCPFCRRNGDGKGCHTCLAAVVNGMADVLPGVDVSKRVEIGFAVFKALRERMKAVSDRSQDRG